MKGEVVWITGASSGIGEALAKQFAARGAKLVLSARRLEELERVRQLILAARPDASVEVLQLDVTDDKAVAAAAEQVLAGQGRVDWLINNAGISQRSLCVDTDLATYRKLVDVDLIGQIALTKAVLPIMIKQQSGHIAVTSSVAGKMGVPYRTGYCAVKHAVMGFFDALRAEVAGDGIRVTTITPGYIRTDISRHALKGDGSTFGHTDTDIAGGMDVDACAKVIMRGFDRGMPEIPVGKGREMHGLWAKRFFPGFVFKMTEKMMKRGVRKS